jgi:hypothetical protein
MFKKLFKINKESETLVLEKISNKSDNEIIQEIHDSYDNAHKDIISWANDIISNANTDDIKKGERLAKLGFINTIKAKFSEKEIKLKQEAEDKANLINYYNINYPFNKFITKEQVSQINKKYNLVCVTADCYLMDIPEKNLQEIENFKIKNNKDLVFQGVLDEIQALAETDLPNPPSAEEVKGASELMAASHVDQDSAKESDATVEVAETNLLKIISDRMDTLDKIIPYFEKHMNAMNAQEKTVYYKEVDILSWVDKKDAPVFLLNIQKMVGKLS